MMLLEHFKELSLHPKNAEELKGLILELAMQGKLTAQWRLSKSFIEPAGSLLEQAKKHKDELIQQKVIKKDKEIAEPSLEEIPYSTPANWSWARLQDIFRFIDYRGKTPKKIDKGVRLITAKNVRMGYLKMNPAEFISENEYDSWMTRGFPERGDLLFTTEAPLGKVCQLNLSEKVGLAQRIITFQSFSQDLERQFMMYCLMSKSIQKLILEKATGMTASGIKSSRLKLIPVPIPPPEEQKAIVQIVEQLFQEVEQLESLTKTRISLKEDFTTSALRRLTEEDTSSAWAYLKPHFQTFFTEESNVKKLRESILQLAVQGKLTAKWRAANPDREHASLLLERIKEEKAQLIKEKKICKEKPLPSITEEEMPFELPEEWVWCRLGSIGDWGAGATPLRSNPEYYEGKFNWFKSGELNNGLIDYESEEKITQKALDETSVRMNQIGDVLIAMYGATIGKTGILEVEGTTNQAVCACTPYSCISSEYLHLILQALKTQFTNQGEGGAQPNISRVKIRNQVFALPPSSEQKEIISLVERLTVFCNELSKSIDDSSNYQEYWMQSCLREVFEGDREEVEHV